MRQSVQVDVDKALKNGKQSMPSKDFHNSGHVKRVHKAVISIIGSRSGYDAKVVRVAAAFHDVGHSSSANGHEQISARKVEQYLRDQGVDNEQYIEDVKGAILSTEMNQGGGAFHTNIKNSYGKALADADVHNFGLPWEKFIARNDEVRREVGEPKGKRWYQNTLDLLQRHTWHSGGGQVYQNKQRNIERLKEKIEEYK